MRRWGFVITAFYVVVVGVLALPGFALLLFKTLPTAPKMLQELSILDVLQAYYEWWGIWLYAGILGAGEALLLFLSVDTSWRHARPRQHVAVTAILASLFAAVLTWLALISIGAAIYGDHAPPLWKGKEDLFALTVLGVLVAFWVIWGGVFYQYYRDSSNVVSRVVAWLLRGSVLELLIAVPAHVIVRQRGDCSAPLATGFGIVTGLAIMLLCFGPGVLALYKRKIDSYSRAPKKREEAASSS